MFYINPLYILFKITFVFVVYQHIDQCDGSIFHVINDTVNLRYNIVVENLKDNCYDQPEYRGQSATLIPPATKEGFISPAA